MKPMLEQFDNYLEKTLEHYREIMRIKYSEGADTTKYHNYEWFDEADGFYHESFRIQGAVDFLQSMENVPYFTELEPKVEKFFQELREILNLA